MDEARMGEVRRGERINRSAKPYKITLTVPGGNRTHI
jgi:hypothetical protein